ncbi:arginine kinase [Drosophila innubila]|uniref:arginine kinase n=1 Tax=Drosophila innubila TaxID=198719 RepID=UPI00148CE924|nr:arginine kinase [Drosophila innubila]
MLSLRMRILLPRLIPFRYYSKSTGGCSEIPEHVMEEMEEGFKNLCYSDSKSLLKKHLTREIFDKLKEKTTPTYKSTLLDCIRSGLCNFNSHVGIYAPDPEAYTTFADIFDPIIEEYHGFKNTDKHPASCFGYGADFPDLDPERKYIISTRVRCGRSVKNFPFNPRLTQCDYAQLQTIISKALGNLCREHSGKYYPLCQMDAKTKEELISKHYLFKEDDPFLDEANALRFWPLGRGIFLNRARTFIVWLNEEDHIRVIAMEKGGNLGRVYERMIIGVESLAHQMQFNQDARLGYLTFCPTNLGTSIRASVHMKLPSVGNDRTTLEEVAGKYNLQVRGTRGEHTEAEGGVYDISNQRRMGLTEYETISEMYKGIQALINAECEKSREKERKAKNKAKNSPPVSKEDQKKAGQSQLDEHRKAMAKKCERPKDQKKAKQCEKKPTDQKKDNKCEKKPTDQNKDNKSDSNKSDKKKK